MKELKEKLRLACGELIDERIRSARSAMDTAQAAANEEGKATVGDKHETARAMMQAERDKNARQLDEALKMKKIFDLIPGSDGSRQIQAGNLVVTDRGWFFLSVGAGKIIVDSREVFCLSPLSPLGNIFLGKTVNDTVTLNGNSYAILEIH